MLYTKVADLPAVTEDITYYAVFAKQVQTVGSAPAVITFDKDHQEGWTNTATDKGSYWLLDTTGKELTSPEIDLSGLSSITVKIRTYGGQSYNTLNVTANGNKIATITANSKTLTEYTWTNTSSLSGIAPITFSTNYETDKGIGISSATINATGVGTSYERYITSCDGTTVVMIQPAAPQAHKVLRDGQLIIIYQGREYNILGL